jgi:hypothetical protein
MKKKRFRTVPRGKTRRVSPQIERDEYQDIVTLRVSSKVIQFSRHGFQLFPIANPQTERNRKFLHYLDKERIAVLSMLFKKSRGFSAGNSKQISHA